MAKKKEKKDSYIIYASQLEDIKDDFSYEELGKLFAAINHYVLTGEVVVFEDKALKIALKSFIRTIKYNQDKYQEICENNKEKAKKRWNKTDASVSNSLQQHAVVESAMHNDNDNDNDTDIDIDIDTDNDTDSECEYDINNNTPTLEQVTEYINLNNYSVDPKKFYSCYQSKGWKGITDWKAKIDYWQYEDKKSNSTDFNDLDW